MFSSAFEASVNVLSVLIVVIIHFLLKRVIYSLCVWNFCVDMVFQITCFVPLFLHCEYVPFSMILLIQFLMSVNSKELFWSMFVLVLSAFPTYNMLNEKLPIFILVARSCLLRWNKFLHTLSLVLFLCFYV